MLSTAPNIRSVPNNFFSEVVGTFVLVFAALSMSGGTYQAFSDPDAAGEIALGSVGALPIALVVFGIGMSLGGTTGYAINPARDLGPRIVHALLPIRGKGGSDWGYSWIPIAGPLAGGLLAAAVHALLVTE